MQTEEQVRFVEITLFNSKTAVGLLVSSAISMEV